MSWLIKRSFSIAGHRTSIALEAEYWQVLEQLAAAQKVSLSSLVSNVDAERWADRPLASALRLYVLKSLH